MSPFLGGTYKWLGHPLHPLSPHSPSRTRGVTTADAGQLNVASEANKIAGNVGMFRNQAGVHWRSDHEQSVLLGEKIAISILQDQKWLYNESFSQGWQFHKFKGDPVSI